MADKKISQLDPLTIAADSDEFAIVDNSDGETKRISRVNFMGSPGSIGSVNPDTAEFTILESDSLKLTGSAVVTHISTDPNLGTSNTRISTQGAVKAYVDAQVSFKETVKRISSDTTAIAYNILLVDTTNGDVTVEMLDTIDGRLAVKKVSNDSNQVIVTTSSGATIDGQAQFTITTQFQSYYFLIDSGEFFVI